MIQLNLNIKFFMSWDGILIYSLFFPFSFPFVCAYEICPSPPWKPLPFLHFQRAIKAQSIPHQISWLEISKKKGRKLEYRSVISRIKNSRRRWIRRLFYFSHFVLYLFSSISPCRLLLYLFCVIICISLGHVQNGSKIQNRWVQKPVKANRTRIWIQISFPLSLYFFLITCLFHLSFCGDFPQNATFDFNDSIKSSKAPKKFTN